MVRIPLDHVLLERLNGLREDCELCDDHGLVVVRVSCTSSAAATSPLSSYFPNLSEVEFERLSQSTECGISTSELLQKMGSKK